MIIRYPDGITNICYNALDVHVASDLKDSTALIYDSPVTNTILKYTYSELLIKVCEVTAVLKEFGVGKGDKVLIYMQVAYMILQPMLLSYNQIQIP